MLMNAVRTNMTVKMASTVSTLWGPISATPMGLLARHAILDLLIIEQRECAWVSLSLGMSVFQLFICFFLHCVVNKDVSLFFNVNGIYTQFHIK